MNGPACSHRAIPLWILLRWRSEWACNPFYPIQWPPKQSKMPFVNMTVTVMEWLGVGDHPILQFLRQYKSYLYFMTHPGNNLHLLWALNYQQTSICWFVQYVQWWSTFIVCSAFCSVIAWCTVLINGYVILMASHHISLHYDIVYAYLLWFWCGGHPVENRNISNIND